MDCRRLSAASAPLVLGLVLAIAVVLPASAGTAPTLEISRTGTATYELAWEAIPDETYHVETATDFVNGPWVDLTPEGLVTPHVTGAYADTFADPARFFSHLQGGHQPAEGRGGGAGQ